MLWRQSSWRTTTIFGGPDCDSYCCRAITGGTQKSLHSYGIAIDVNANTNPYTAKPPTAGPSAFRARSSQAERARDVQLGDADTDMTPELIADVRAIKTDGRKVRLSVGRRLALPQGCNAFRDQPGASRACLRR